MPQIKEYRVASGSSTVDLTEQVNAMISEGWQPIGGICVTIVSPDNIHEVAASQQAMVR